MKIFDFSEGRKGRLLADDLPKATGSPGIVGNIEVTISRYRYYRECQYTPNDYGVDAICFCVGKQENNDDEWEWWFVADLSWVLSLRNRWDSEKSDLIHGTKATNGKPISLSQIARGSELYRIIDTVLEMELSFQQTIDVLGHTILLTDGTVIKQGAITLDVVEHVNSLHQVDAV